jgi:hypothetical protein
MSKRRKSSLEDDVQAVFERACAEQDFQVAEHLMQALEAFAHRNKNGDRLNRLYMTFISSLHDKKH